MPRQLPPRPNLEHLRKQAKDLLYRRREHDSSARLADAQHALAREYGFASWPKLKAYVESVSIAPSESRSPFAGRWEANVSKSKRHPDNLFRSAIVEFDVSADAVRITDSVVDASGREERGVNTIDVDGVEHAVDSRHGYSLTATWRGSHVLETIARQNGEVVGTGEYRVSTDGRTLSVTSDQMSIVFDRVDAGREPPARSLQPSPFD